MRGHTQPWTTPPRADVVFTPFTHAGHTARLFGRSTPRFLQPLPTYTMAKKVKQVFVQESQCGPASARRRGPTSPVDLDAGSARRRRRRSTRCVFFTLPRTRRRAARAPVSSAPSPQARAMIEYHKCRVSSFSNWVRYLRRNQPVAGRDLPRYSHRARPPLRRSSSTKRPSRHSPPKFSSSSSRRRSATPLF